MPRRNCVFHESSQHASSHVYEAFWKYEYARIRGADVWITWALICAKEILWCLTRIRWTIDKLRDARNVWTCWMKFITRFRAKISRWRETFLMDRLIGWNTIGSRDSWQFTTRSDEIEELKITIDVSLFFFSFEYWSFKERRMIRIMFRIIGKWVCIMKDVIPTMFLFFSFEKRLKFNKEGSR